MFRRRSTQFRAWICFIAYLFTGIVTGGRGFVLCSGPNGHLALELAKLGDCTGCEEHATADPIEERCFVESGSRPCVDVPIILDSDFAKREVARPKAPSEPAADTARRVIPPQFAPHANALSHARASAVLRIPDSSLRTIVLLV